MSTVQPRISAFALVKLWARISLICIILLLYIFLLQEVWPYWRESNLLLVLCWAMLKMTKLCSILDVNWRTSKIAGDHLKRAEGIFVLWSINARSIALGGSSSIIIVIKVIWHLSYKVEKKLVVASVADIIIDLKQLLNNFLVIFEPGMHQRLFSWWALPWVWLQHPHYQFTARFWNFLQIVRNNRKVAYFISC